MEIIKYNGQDITAQFKSGRWSHPVTGGKYPSNFPPSEIDGVTVEIVPDPLPEIAPIIKSWSPLAFLELFSDEKQLAVKQAAMSNAQIGLWYDKLLASQEVVANDERLLNGLAFMIANGILTQAEVDTALS